VFNATFNNILDCNNLKSVYQHPQVALQKLQSKLNLGRIMGPFRQRPIYNIRCSPIGLIPKKTGGNQNSRDK
jgi:hypothetical protein